MHNPLGPRSHVLPAALSHGHPSRRCRHAHRARAPGRAPATMPTGQHPPGAEQQASTLTGPHPRNLNPTRGSPTKTAVEDTGGDFFLLNSQSKGEGNGNPLQLLLPGKSRGRRSLVGYSPWGRKESDTTERLHFHRAREPSRYKTKKTLKGQRKRHLQSRYTEFKKEIIKTLKRLRKAIDRNADDYKNELETGAKKTQETFAKIKSWAAGAADRLSPRSGRRQWSQPARPADKVRLGKIGSREHVPPYTQ